MGGMIGSADPLLPCSSHARQCVDRMGVVFRAKIRHRRVLFPVHGHAAIISIEPVNDHVPLSIGTALAADMRVTATSPPTRQQQGVPLVWTQGRRRERLRSLPPSVLHAAVSGVSLAGKDKCDKDVPGKMHFDTCARGGFNGLLLRGGGSGLSSYHFQDTAPSSAPLGSDCTETESLADFVDILQSL